MTLTNLDVQRIYNETGSVIKTARAFGMSIKTVHGHLSAAQRGELRKVGRTVAQGRKRVITRKSGEQLKKTISTSITAENRTIPDSIESLRELRDIIQDRIKQLEMLRVEEIRKEMVEMGLTQITL